MKRIASILVMLALAGCAGLDGKLENRVACTVAKDKLYAISEYGPVGISATMSDKDRAVICR